MASKTGGIKVPPALPKGDVINNASTSSLLSQDSAIVSAIGARCA
jgi:hypothetical protein